MSHTPTNPGQHQSVSQSQTDHNPLKDDKKGATPQFVVLHFSCRIHNPDAARSRSIAESRTISR